MILSLPYKLIEEAQRKNSLDTLAYWLRLRPVKTVYNYNTRNVGAILKLSPTTASKHIKIMLNMGLVHLRGKNLIVSGNKKLKLLYDKKYELIQIFNTKRKQKLALMALLLKKTVKGQIKKINIKLKIFKQLRERKLTKSSVRTISRTGGLAVFKKSFFSRPMLSNKRIGRTLFVTPRTASKYQKEMDSIGVIQKSRNLLSIGKCDVKGFLVKKENNPALVLINNILYRQLPNNLSFPSYVDRTKLDNA